MIFGRVKPLDAILATAEKKSLHRTLGAFQLTMLGIGAIIGTGIFVLTAEAAQKAGPGMMWSFVIAGLVCVVAALCYSELASMVPVSGSAYTYTYAVMGELLAWTVGWALILEYAVAASAVSVGWSGYFVGLLSNAGIELPMSLTVGPYAGGIVNLPALVIALLVTWLLMIGTTESARVNAVLVIIKVTALTMFIILTLPMMQGKNFEPFLPNGWFGQASGLGAVGAAASIFFAYVGFDAVSTAAEETKNPQRNVPIGLIASLAICTVFYLAVAAGAIGTVGAQPVSGLGGEILAPGSSELAARCASLAAAGSEPLVCSREALAHVLREIGHPALGNAIGLAAFLALPSVILIMLFGQTRIFFVMARDGLLPEKLATIHPKWKTPHVVTMITGVAVAFFAAFLPVGKLADISNSGTLFAFFMVAIAVLILRIKEPNRHRPFRTPLVWVVSPLAIFGTLGLYMNLPFDAKMVLPVWGGVGLVLYFLYGYRRSHVGRGIVEVHEDDADAPPPPVPPAPSFD
ncbi:MAG: amino acid permease [Sphingopyxis sp.]|uniref:Amino acid permease n=1 Tax=Sphingopyxis terrae subsp. terrae NBRC 15098 TaxID=1219058 RepID=A0A142W0F0_9SPHN|nr:MULTISPECIES: amino acid permease [Sphingopyxis]AMU95005.1 amino acid permease [Sphingopyxis terrae subsp. terrae NBRC 15098]MBD3747014.1 amino acid permease [Sphingopyxis terrae]QXF13419.1 amino acid permease [Sphingopyxis terrae subsp. terrae]